MLDLVNRFLQQILLIEIILTVEGNELGIDTNDCRFI